MSIRSIIKRMRDSDKGISRWYAPDKRRVLIDARTPMNYAMIEAVRNAMRVDPRVFFYFTSSESPMRAAQTFLEFGETERVITPKRARLMRFDAYIAADY